MDVAYMYMCTTEFKLGYLNLAEQVLPEESKADFQKWLFQLEATRHMVICHDHSTLSGSKSQITDCDVHDSLLTSYLHVSICTM